MKYTCQKVELRIRILFKTIPLQYPCHGAGWQNTEKLINSASVVGRASKSACQNYISQLETALLDMSESSHIWCGKLEKYSISLVASKRVYI